MSKRLFANFAKGKLNAGIAAGATAFTLQGGQGALFPTTATGKSFHVVGINSAGDKEIIKVTTHAAASDTFAVVDRGEQGTTPLDFDAGNKIELRITSDDLDAFVQEFPVVTVVADETLDYDDFNTTRVVTASANITLPASTAVDVGDSVKIKSLTTGHVRLTPDGTDTIDGLNALYRLPSFCQVELIKVAAGQWALLGRPEHDVGDLVFWPVDSATAKLGYLFADNVAESRATYAGLFAVYGVTHGAGDGATTFGKPDMRDRVPIGRGNMGGAAAGRITSGGNDTDTGNINTAIIGAAGGSENSQRHDHVITASYARLPDGTGEGTQGVGIAQEPARNYSNQNITADAALAGAGQSGNIQPGLVGNWLVKT